MVGARRAGAVAGPGPEPALEGSESPWPTRRPPFGPEILAGEDRLRLAILGSRNAIRIASIQDLSRSGTFSIPARSCHRGPRVGHPRPILRRLAPRCSANSSRSFTSASGTPLAPIWCVTAGAVPRTRHDAFFVHVFGRPLAAAIIFRRVLPAAMLAELRLETLVLASAAYRQPSRTPARLRSRLRRRAIRPRGSRAVPGLPDARPPVHAR